MLLLRTILLKTPRVNDVMDRIVTVRFVDIDNAEIGDAGITLGEFTVEHVSLRFLFGEGC